MAPTILPALTAEHAPLHGFFAQPAPEPVAERLGAWELVDLVAEGTFSRVFRARASGAGADTSPPAYAVKRLKPELEDNALAVQLLRREARVGGAVHHPRLAPILAANVERSPFYLVMPWLSGSTLESIFDRAHDDAVARGASMGGGSLAAPLRPPLPLIHSLWFARQIAEALAALDAAGWVHSDVKPSNVMISPLGHATLIDLGLARRPADEDHSIDRAQVGTPAYMAPELFVSTIRPDIRSDIFSLGVLLCELLTGRRFNRRTDSLQEATIPRRPTALDLRDLSRVAPPAVAQLVQQMMAGEPLRRPQTPAELVDELVALEVEFFADGIE